MPSIEEKLEIGIINLRRLEGELTMLFGHVNDFQLHPKLQTLDHLSAVTS